MAVDGLPKGLVSNKEGVQPADDGEDCVQAEHVAYLWRGIASQQKHILSPIANGAFV